MEVDTSKVRQTPNITFYRLNPRLTDEQFEIYKKELQKMYDYDESKPRWLSVLPNNIYISENRIKEEGRKIHMSIHKNIPQKAVMHATHNVSRGSKKTIHRGIFFVEIDNMMCAILAPKTEKQKKQNDDETPPAVHEMMEYEMNIAKRDCLVNEHGFKTPDFNE